MPPPGPRVVALTAGPTDMFNGDPPGIVYTVPGGWDVLVSGLAWQVGNTDGDPDVSALPTVFYLAPSGGRVLWTGKITDDEGGSGLKTEAWISFALGMGSPSAPGRIWDTKTGHGILPDMLLREGCSVVAFHAKLGSTLWDGSAFANIGASSLEQATMYAEFFPAAAVASAAWKPILLPQVAGG